MQIGPYQLSNPWILAPMAGVSEMPFRVLALQMGAGAAPTELVSAKGLLYGQARTARYLTHDPIEKPFWVQIFGGDEESMAQGAERAAELGADIIDINMGCPVKKVTKNGAGSALLCDLNRAFAIVNAIVKRTGKPVTVKVRSGWDADNMNPDDLAKRFADVGCAAIAMHARTRAQAYSGKADWSRIARMVEHSPIPVIGNGDVTTVADANRMLKETGCAAVMIGRGALGNPWIFRQLTTGNLTAPTAAERWKVVRNHLHAHLEFVGHIPSGIKRFRPHLMWYAHGLTNAAQFRNHATQIEELEELLHTCEHFFLGAQVDKQDSSLAQEFDTHYALG